MSAADDRTMSGVPRTGMVPKPPSIGGGAELLDESDVLTLLPWDLFGAEDTAHPKVSTPPFGWFHIWLLAQPLNEGAARDQAIERSFNWSQVGVFARFAKVNSGAVQCICTWAPVHREAKGSFQ